MSRGRDGPDVAADSVIGFILITAISLGAIALVLLAGGPTLERIQSQQEQDSMIRFMEDLDHGVSSLLSGAPAGSTPIWSVSMPRGSVELQNDGHMWGFAVNHEVSSTTWDVVFADFGDGTDSFQFEAQNNSIQDLQLNVTVWDGTSDTALAFTSPSNGDTIAAGSATTVELDQAMAGTTIEVKIFDETVSASQPIARAWFIDAGAVVWQHSTNQILQVAYQNSAILASTDGGEVFHNAPRVRGPQDKGGDDESIFLRVVKFDGTLSVAGRTSADVLLSSGGNHPRYSGEDVAIVDLYPPNRWEQAWIGTDCTSPTGRLANDNLGYTYKVLCNPIDSTLEPVARRYSGSLSGGTLSATLVETGVTLEGATLS